MNAKLNLIREHIDTLDEEIVSLLAKRANFALQAAKIKKKAGASGKIYDSQREADVIARLLQLDHGALHDAMLSSIYGSIISACRNLQIQQYELLPAKVTVSVMGIAGSYSELAALRFLQQQNMEDYSLSYDATSQQVVAQVIAKQADYGVVGISNSTAGLVQETLHALAGKACKIVSVVTLPVEHKLMALPQADNIKAVYSHEQALTQCARYLQKQYPDATCHAYDDTALAAQHLHEGKLSADSAIIANARCADLYNLKIIADNIIDKADNATTFLVIGQTDTVGE